MGHSIKISIHTKVDPCMSIRVFSPNLVLIDPKKVSLSTKCNIREQSKQALYIQPQEKLFGMKKRYKRACLLYSRILHYVLSDTFFGPISTKFGENTLIDMGQLL